jgi:anti-sigma B factor antagonist
LADVQTPGLRIDVSEEAGAVQATLGGELDLTTAESLQDRVRSLLEGGATVVRLDLGEVAFVDSTGLGALVQSHRLAGEHSARFELTNVPERVRRLMEITKLTELLPIVP